MKELIIIQSTLKAPKNQYNKFGNYNYRSCEDIKEAVKPLLKEQDCFLTLSDEVIEVGGRVYVKATAKITNNKGLFVETVGLAREAGVKKGMDDSQITGTASSYARKYALNGLLAIDDTKDADTQEPPQNKPKPIVKLEGKQLAEIKDLIEITGASVPDLLKFLKAKTIEDLNYETARRALLAKKAKLEKEAA